jgi:hypothetical protein
MNEAHFHLLVNHFPIIGSFFSVIVIASGFILKNPVVRKTGYALLIFSALTTLPAFFSGEDAEELVEHLPGVSHKVIHEHEETAELALWISHLTGLLAIFAWYFEATAHRLGRLFSYLALISNLAMFGTMARAGNTGGKIMHQELNGTYTVAPAESESEEGH